MNGITRILKGINGEYELIRTVGAVGVLAFILTACGLEIFEAVKHDKWDIVAFCAAFPAGLGVAIGAVAGSAVLKDRGVVTSQVIRDTGAVPVAPPQGPPVPQPVPVPQEN